MQYESLDNAKKIFKETEIFEKLFENDEQFQEVLEDALLQENLKLPTKYSILVDDIEKQLKKAIKAKTKLHNDILFVNYKRYLYKHILEIEKMKTLED